MDDTLCRLLRHGAGDGTQPIIVHYNVTNHNHYQNNSAPSAGHKSEFIQPSLTYPIKTRSLKKKVKKQRFDAETFLCQEEMRHVYKCRAITQKGTLCSRECTAEYGLCTQHTNRQKAVLVRQFDRLSLND